MKNENTVEKVLEIKVRYDDAIRNIFSEPELGHAARFYTGIRHFAASL